MTKPAITLRLVKGSELTFQEGDDNFANLRDATITVSDGSNSTPIDLNGQITFAAGSGVSVAESNGTITITNTQSAGIGNVSEDTTPQLGGNLDVNGNGIVSTSNGNIALTPDGTGSVVLDGLNWPQADGTNGQVLTTDGSGQLSFADAAGGIALTDLSGTNGVSYNSSTGAISLTTSGLPSPYTGTINSIDSGADNIELSSSAGITMGMQITFTGANLSGTGIMADTAYYITNVAGSTIQINSTMSGAMDINSVGSYSGITWSAQSTGGGSSYILKKGTSGTIAWETETTPATPSISTLSGVSINSVADGDMLMYDSNFSYWKNSKTFKGYKETIYDLGTTSGTITPDISNGNVQTITLNGNLTLNGFNSPVSGQSITLIVKQDATGSRTLTSTMKWAGGTKTLTTAANSIDIISIFYDGTNYWASLSTDFK